MKRTSKQYPNGCGALHGWHVRMVRTCNSIRSDFEHIATGRPSLRFNKAIKVFNRRIIVPKMMSNLREL